jgi:hypothetical protein
MEQIKKPLEWDELMKPYRESRLFCKEVKRRINTMYSKEDIIKGIMSMGYNEVEAMYYFNPIDETKRQGLNKWERKGDDN